MINFKTGVNVLFFLFLTAINGFWIYARLRKNRQIKLAPYIVMNVLLFIFWARMACIDSDETEHLHCAWLVSQGLIPFRDFWQHHSPFLWVVLSPLIKICKPSPVIFEFSRAGAFVISLLNICIGWIIARKCWRDKAGLSVYLLIISAFAVFGQYCWLRPDLFMYFFLLIGIYASLAIPGAGVLPSLLAGIAFGIAASFTIKQNALCLAPLIIIFRESRRSKLVKISAYLGGFVLGTLPLAYYLVSRGIVSEFFTWVLKFNGGRLVFSTLIPVPAAVMGIWGGSLLFRRVRSAHDHSAFAALVFLCLTTFNALTGLAPAIGGGYNLGFWFIICAIAASGCSFAGLRVFFKSVRVQSFVLSCILVSFVFPNLILNLPNKYETNFMKNKEVIGRLMEYCGTETCVALVPIHPVFNLDASRLFLIWQKRFVYDYDDVKNDLKKHDIAAQIRRNRPAAVVYRINGRLTVIDLLLNGLVTKPEYKELLRFFENEYTIRKIGNEQFYIRNDRL